jgi:RHS repeat-associated protein
MKLHGIIPLLVAVCSITTSSVRAQEGPSPVAVTDADIFRSRIFPEPLVPIGRKTSPKENIALSKAIDLCLQRKDQDDQSAIINFLRQHPKSAWRAALLTNLGLAYRHSGWFLKALDAWEEAWALGKNEKSVMGKPLIDRAVGELAELNARLGRRERVEAILKEIGDRPLIGPATEKVTAAREGVWMMAHEPGNAFKCGPFALDRILSAQTRSITPDPKILSAQSTDHGMSLDQVWRLSNELGMNYQMAKRKPGSEVMVPSVVNWKANHYAALIREDGVRFVLQDPTFGGDILVSKAALDAESSGYFLVPNGHLPEGWRRVSAIEASKIWGMGSTGDHDPSGTKLIDDKAKPDCQHSGMASYNFHTQLVSLNIMDTPVGYTPPRGPDMHLTVTYNQREATGSSGINRPNFGSKWVCNWVAYVEDDATSPSLTATAHIPGGGSEGYSTDPAPQSGAVMTRDYNPSPPASPQYTRTLPDGSQQVFDFLSYYAFTETRRFYMTKWIDPAGNAIQFHYDPNTFRLVSVTDAVGNPPTTISYISDDPNILPDFFLIKQVTDGFGRSAFFDYQNGQLSAIHDTVGITSSFIYATGSDFINSMTTPYTTTAFSMPPSSLDGSSPPSGNARVIQAVDQTTEAVERVEYGHLAPGIPNTETTLPNVPGVSFHNGIYAYRNSFYWDQNATAMNPPTHDSDCNCDVYDFTKAKLTEWLHYDGGTCSNIKEREKRPLENAVYYFYQGQSDTVFAGVNGFPTKVARVLDDGSTQLWQYSYNPIGKVTQAIDPTNRVTSYFYPGNNIDLQYVYQRNPAGTSIDPSGAHADLIASYTNYNSLHEPGTATDAAGQPTYNTYNSFGQITMVQNARNDVTSYVYSDGTISGVPNGYLASITSPTFNGSQASTSFTYDGANRVQSATNSPDNYTITNDYDNLDRPTTITYPDGTTQQFSYTDTVRGMTLDLTANKDRLNRWTYRHYDDNRNLDSITDPLGQTTYYNWCACGALTSITDANGSGPGDPEHTTTFIRDLQSRITSKVFADNSSIDYAYENTTSRLQSMTDANGQTTNYEYDVDDNLHRTSYSNALNPTPTVLYIYDANYNRVSSMIDGLGTSNYAYYPVAVGTFGAGKLYQVSGPFTNDTITYGYDELGRMTSQDINGTGSTVSYDSLGRADTTNNPLGSFSRVYDSDVTPRLKTLNYPNGQTAKYDYFDNSGDRRLKTLQNIVGPSTNLSQHDYTYDPDGKIQTWKKILGTNETDLSFSYDGAKQLRSVLQPGVTLGYDYDAAGNRLDSTFHTSPPHSHSGGDVFTANKLNELDTVLRNSGFGPTFTDPVPLSYDANGNMTYDGNNQTYEWDAANRLVAVNYLDSGNRTEFAYDGLGRMRAIGVIGVTNVGPDSEFSARVRPSGSPTPAYYAQFNSAPLSLAGGDYLLSFQGLNPNGGDNTAFIDAVTLNGSLLPNGSFETPDVTNINQGIDGDPAGATWNFVGTSGITINGSDFTVGNPPAPAGSQVAYVQGTASFSQELTIPPGTYTLSLWSAQRGNFQNSYQEFNVDLKPVNTGGVELSVVSGKTFVWCGNRICEERDASGSTTTKRFFAEGEQRVGGSDAGLYYYSRDHLGSVREVTDASGNVVSQLDYDAWGNEVVVAGNMSVDFGFTGHYFHQPSGLNLARYRAYNPTLGRWISRDPIGEETGINLYGYVMNDPIRLIDPIGLDWWNPWSWSKPGPYLPEPSWKPPGWQPNWNTGTDSRGPFSQPPDGGPKWYPHPEDPGHWPHYDTPDGARFPQRCLKPWPNQKIPPYDDQSPTNPWPQASPPEGPPWWLVPVLLPAEWFVPFFFGLPDMYLPAPQHSKYA